MTQDEEYAQRIVDVVGTLFDAVMEGRVRVTRHPGEPWMMPKEAVLAIVMGESLLFSMEDVVQEFFPPCAGHA